MIIHSNSYQAKILSICFLIIIVGCSSSDSSSDIDFEKKEVKEISLLMSADSSDTFVSPAWIKAESDAFFFYDVGRNQVSRFDIDGQHLLSFGQEGKGPGEFQSPGDLWKFDDRYLIYDNNSRKFVSYDADGNHIEDMPLDFIDFSGIPEIEAIRPQQFVMSSGGKNGSLLALVDMASASTQYIGEAVDKNVDSQGIQSPDDRHQAISSGNIPAMDENNVLLSSNESGIFSFQQTTANLEKYSHSGSLLWQKNLKVPEIEGLFDYLFEENKSRLDSGKSLLQFAYGYGISANDDGVGVLLNVREGQPVAIAWVLNNGKGVTVVTYEDLEHPSPIPLRFAISLDGSHILFGNTLEGKIYNANWPL
jgi:hypothetical protein